MPNHSFAQAIALLAAEAGEALLPSARQPTLVARARGLPPILEGLFEVSLLDEGIQVALHQRVGQRSREVSRLQKHMAERGVSLDSPIPPDVALVVAKLLAEWQIPTSDLYETMLEVWLEYACATDNDGESKNGGGTATLTPSLFIGLSQALISPDERWHALQIALDILLTGHWRVWHEALLRTMVVCPPEAFVSHIGVMLGGSTPALRVNVKRLRPKTLASYLTNVEWRGDIVEAVARAEDLFLFADHITLCLDLGAEVYPHLGFECTLIAQSATETRWAALLDYLVGQGLCSAAKRDAFLGWAGMTTPLMTGRDWPDQLILESLSQPSNHLSVLHRRFSHVKIAYSPLEPPAAKGYLHFMPQWLKL